MDGWKDGTTISKPDQLQAGYNHLCVNTNLLGRAISATR
jgi:hypothetical protein